MIARRHIAGMTLVELVVAMTVTTLVAGATTLVLRGLAGVRERAERQEALDQEARVAADAIVTALRNAVRCPEDGLLLEGVDNWRGDLPADRVRFFSVSGRTIRSGRPESDVRECEFFLARPDGRGEQASGASAFGPSRLPALIRRTDPTRNPQPDGGGVLEPIALNIIALDLSYLDGTEWTGRWRKSRRDWPMAIRVRLVAATETQPRRTATVTRIVSWPYRPAEQEQSSPPAGSSGQGGQSS